jgi:hypothetical protein
MYRFTSPFPAFGIFVTVQAGCGRQLKKVFKILQLDLDIA